MKLIFPFMLTFVFVTACAPTQTPSASQAQIKTQNTIETPEVISEVTPEQTLVKSVIFKASDGGDVYADIHRSQQTPAKALIVLFHQAGSNGRGEYADIMPRLLQNGYDLLVVDQRSGGGHFGAQNRTVKARGESTKYCAAYPDLEGALRYAKTLRPDGPVFAWGSSYSAALVLKLAGEHGDDLAGVLSFSPATGRAMGECNANNFISGVKIPALGMKPAREMDATGKAQKQAYLAQGLDYFVAEDGVHGSSMLVKSRTHKDVEPAWTRVLAFLDAHT